VAPAGTGVPDGDGSVEGISVGNSEAVSGGDGETVSGGDGEAVSVGNGEAVSDSSSSHAAKDTAIIIASRSIDIFVVMHLSVFRILLI
jgi:hypothetical protein